MGKARGLTVAREGEPGDASFRGRVRGLLAGIPQLDAAVDRERRQVLAWGLVGLAVLFNLWVLRAEVLPVQNLNDSSIHASMVRWARYRIESGHLPFDGWYPYLSLGASRFHHYQSLPHILTGTLSAILRTDRVFSFSLYLLLAFWPVSVYWGMRLFGWSAWASAAAALVSPLVVSEPGLGYEWGSYIWRGYGTWSQLWGMWLLPLAWGLSWRAVTGRGSPALGALAVALTIAVHLLTGYLALLSIGVWVLLRPSRFLRRFLRAAVVGAGSLFIAAWVIVPIVLDRTWTPQSEISRGTIFYDSFGAKRILGWLLTGQIFDRDRLPVLTILVGLGLLVCVARSVRDERARSVLAVGLLSLLLFFGRPTLGPVLKLLPGSSDLFLRRYVFGAHLAGIFLAGVGIAALGGSVRAWVTERFGRLKPAAATAALVGVAVIGLFPAWSERATYAGLGARWIHEQRALDATDGADVVALTREAQGSGPGRIFAGLRGGNGGSQKVGQVPLYAYLLNQDADAVGFTRPAWSLSSPIEVRFDPTNPDQYELLGIRYVIWPGGQDPLVPATFVEARGTHALWRLGGSGYIAVVDTTTPIAADRTNLGATMTGFLRSDLLHQGLFPTVAFAGRPAAPPTAAGVVLSGAPGAVLVETDLPEDGTFSATVQADRPAMVLLKASFDNRWQVFVDGVELEPQMVAPSFVGRTISAGQHVVDFRYRAFPRYDLLLAIGVLALSALRFGPEAWRRLRGRPEQRVEEEAP